MTEDKAEKALRKVIVNLIPEEYHGGPIPNDVVVPIDISDKLEDEKGYYLTNICLEYCSEYGTSKKTISYVPFDEYQTFKESVETILDSVLVNDKQRKSVQRLLDRAFWDGETVAKYNAKI